MLQDPAAAAETPLRPQATESGADRSTPHHAARVYLDQARSTLGAVPEANLDHDARKLLSALRQEFNALNDSYRAHAKAGREEARTTIDGNVAGAVDWHARFSDVERRLAEILGGGSSFSPSYAASGTLANSVAGATPAPATQSKAASNPASAALVAPVTSPATTVVTPAPPAGEVSPAPSVSAAAAVAAQPAVANTPPPAAAIPPQSPAASAAAAAAANTPAPAPPGTPPPPAPVVSAAGTGVTPASNPGVGTGSGAAVLAGPGGTVAGATGSGAAAAAGVLVSTIGLKNLDPAVRLQLEQFRTAVELFFDATTRLGS